MLKINIEIGCLHHFNLLLSLVPCCYSGPPPNVNGDDYPQVPHEEHLQSDLQPPRLLLQNFRAPIINRSKVKMSYEPGSKVMILLMMTSQFSLSVAVREEVKPDQLSLRPAGSVSPPARAGRWRRQSRDLTGKMSVQRSSQGEEEKMEETEMNNNADTSYSSCEDNADTEAMSSPPEKEMTGKAARKYFQNNVRRLSQQSQYPIKNLVHVTVTKMTDQTEVRWTEHHQSSPPASPASSLQSMRSPSRADCG